MTDDPLAGFRPPSSNSRPSTQQPTQTEDATGKTPYQAFASKDNQRRARIDIRPKDDLAHAISYSYLIEVVYDRRNYSVVGLVFSTLIVKMRGRNLRPVVSAISLGSCEHVTQFDPREFDSPDSDTEPFIEHMEIVSAAAPRERQDKPA